MSGRPYPDEVAGPFPEPPVSFEDREGRPIDVRGYDPGSEVPAALVEMYESYDPADRAQGIPPSGEPEIRRWLDTLFRTGYNVVAWHDDRAAGHATLVPDDGGDAPGTSGGESHPDDQGRADPHSVRSTPHELAIFVLQAYQRAGIGARLIRALLGFGAAHGVERVWLTVEQWNRPAIGLYESVGFEVSDARSFEREMSIRLG